MSEGHIIENDSLLSLDSVKPKNRITSSKFSILNFLTMLPLIFILGIFLAFPLSIFLTRTFPKIHHVLSSWDSRKLVGMQNSSAMLPLSLKNFFNKSYQLQFETSLDANLPFKSLAVRIHNQIYYDLFSKSYGETGAIIIGKKGYLYESNYLEAYCKSPLNAGSAQIFNQWVMKLANLSKFFKNNHQLFIYVISPSKIDYYPNTLPSNYSCLTPFKHPNYERAIHTLTKTQDIHFIDGVRIVLDNKKKYGTLMFPRGGIHWTLLGAALVAQNLIKQISAATSYQLPLFKFSYTKSHNPFLIDPSDIDLLALANLLKPARNFIVPNVKIQPANHYDHKLKLAIIGDSFSVHLIHALIETHYFSQIDYYNYFKLGHYRFYPSKSNDSKIFMQQLAKVYPVDTNNPKTFQDIFKANIVILEDNEAFIISNQSQLFYNTMMKLL